MAPFTVNQSLIRMNIDPSWNKYTKELNTENLKTMIKITAWGETIRNA